MDIPPAGLLDRIIASDAAYTGARLDVIARWEGNPFGALARHEGDAHGFQVRAVPTPWLNRVIGLRDSQADRVPAFVAWFTRLGIHPRFEVVPGRHGNEMAKMLGHCGFVQSGFDVMTWGQPRRLVDWGVARSSTAGMPIEVVDDEDAIEVFLDAHLEAWAMPEGTREGAKRNMRGWLGQPGWTLLMARHDGEPPCCTWRRGWPISPTLPPGPQCAARARRQRCCGTACTLPVSTGPTWSGAARRSSPAAIATCCAPACEPCARRVSGPR
jgi:hypothetical protein